MSESECMSVDWRVRVVPACPSRLRCRRGMMCARCIASYSCVSRVGDCLSTIVAVRLCACVGVVGCSVAIASPPTLPRCAHTRFRRYNQFFAVYEALAEVVTPHPSFPPKRVRTLALNEVQHAHQLLAVFR